MDIEGIKKCKTQKYMKRMQEVFDLLEGIEGCVEEDFDRLTLASSKQKVEKRGSMNRGGIKKELDVSRCIKHDFFLKHEKKKINTMNQPRLKRV